MTDANREQTITQALAQYQAQAGARDTMRVPLRGASTLLEVVEVPLDLPTLNPDSFRIAPALAEHAQASIVKTDPYSSAAQNVVAELVRKAHRYAEDLKASLIDGQDQPGLITRKGKLINGNTRCVLLRELRAEGKITNSTLRVAVLPADIIEPQELELESVLQKQVEHKDSYNLVSELMMLKKLHEDAGLTDAAIARHLRMRAQRVTDMRAVLDLMERARRLTDPVLPLTEFITEKDQTQNWIELLRKVREVDQKDGRPSGDVAIASWLIAYVLGYDSVHKLRHAYGEWVESDVMEDLVEAGGIGAAIASVAASPVAEAASAGDIPEGLDLLGDEANGPVNSEVVAVKGLLNIAVAATRPDAEHVSLGDGGSTPVADVRDALHASVSRGLAASKQRALAGSKLQRPTYALSQARDGLREALDGLDEVGELDEFAPHREAVVLLIEEIASLLDKVSEAAESAPSAPSSDD
ncbi:hypothetical protein [Demequina zhanjiangensis]|uniref:Chromosome partitioning protein, ParB family n=1 Tax=Demequina zhanjiangensis TaxID=3051659 RepID=A0ABT8G433_9MICO|nr:hypothetical protein [Demequina sp. SYSU T00b26]MDN4473464.1 hypothetical protein [Demequina sp. SYSU T00b26]